MCVLTYEIKSLHSHYGVPPKAGPALRAIVAADLLRRGEYGLSTAMQATLVAGTSRPMVDAAIVLLESQDQSLLRAVLTGRVGLQRAAEKIKPRLKLIQAFKRATPADHLALVREVGADRMFDLTIAAA